MRSAADDVQMTNTPGDNVRMTYPPADNVLDNICHPRADDMHVTPGVVLHEIRQLRQEEAAILNSSA